MSSPPVPATSVGYRYQSQFGRQVLGTRGTKIGLDAPLFTGSPTSGWGVHLVLKGLTHYHEGPNPDTVVSKIYAWLRDNNIDIRPIDTWAIANKAWLARVPSKLHFLSGADLNAVIIEDGNFERAPAAFNQASPDDVRYTGPQVWGNRAWNFLGLYLARDTYDFKEFLSILNIIVEMLDPAKHPSLGCQECVVEATRARDIIKANPIYDQFKARQWLVDFHNTVNARTGKQVISFDQAARLNYWV